MENKQPIFRLKYQMNTCLSVVQEYSWLLDAYLLDFFTENHMKKLPKCWNVLKYLQPEELGAWIDMDRESQFKIAKPVVLPLSLQCLHNILRHWTLMRVVNMTTPSPKKQVSCHIQPGWKSLFTKHVKPKKRYEVSRMAERTAVLASESGVEYIVDVGSGLGHLSRMLAYQYGFHVCCLEKESHLSEQARNLDAELEDIANKYQEDIDLAFVKTHRPVHLQETLSYATVADNFVQVLKKAFNISNAKFSFAKFSFGIVGLHPCGDLAVILTQLFLKCPEAKFMNIIGCCYHKLTTSVETMEKGFPLSRQLKLDNAYLSYESRAIASHAIEIYCDRLSSKDYYHLKIHCYRAALETIVQKHWPHFKRHGFCNVKHVPQMTFQEYCNKALQKVDLQVSLDDVQSPEISKYLDNWRDVVIFYSLRLLLAPLVETVLLLDRMLYLIENGAECSLSAIFDPRISARNQILTAMKPTR